MNIYRNILVATLALIGMPFSSFAQPSVSRCSNRVIAGAYSFSCTGAFLPPGAPQGTAPVPVAMLGVAFGDDHGNWHGRDTLSFNGTLMPQYLTTDPSLGGVPAVVSSDCSGTIKYQVYTTDPKTTSDAVYLGELPINFVVMNNANEIKGLPTAAGYTVVCQLIRQRTAD